VRYKVADTADDWIVIATTRPETIWADVAIAVHPENETYGRLIGREALIPLWDGEKRIPILGDPGIDKDFGTGCLKVTPAHDALDYEIGLRHGLPVVDILNDDGTLAAWAGKYAGLDRFEARKVFAADLEAAGHVVKTETVTNNVGLSERTKAVIEPRLSLQWFVRMEEFVKPALRAVVEGEVKLIPGHFVNTYRHWMENVRDWCISRQLWWGQRVPAYYYPRWEFDTYSREWLPVHGVQDVAVATSREQAFEIAMKNGFQGSIDELVQDEDCLDTWFSSWLWPISVFDGFDDPNNPDINYYYPTNDLVTAPEILFFWVARMIIAGYEWRGQRPFENVYLTGIVRDKLGRKMSKSLGNSPDPLELIAKYSADGVRVGMLLCSPAGNDLKFDESLCEQGRNFVNKLWNAYRLVHGWGGQLSDRAANPTETLALEWFAQRVAEAAHELEGQFGQFRLSEALMTVYKLVWDDFCSWFLEVLKPGREDGLSREVYSRTLDLFEDLLRLLHPFTPFITEEIWNALRPRADRELLIVARLPEFASPDGARLRDMEEIREVVTALRAFRSEKNLAYKIVLPVAIKTRRTELFTAYLPVVQKLANVEFAGFADQSVAGAFSVVVRSHELYITAEGAVDLEAERKKLTDEIEYTEGFRRSVEAKLANEKFVANAKPELVEKERQKLADALAKLATLRESLAHLGA
jgi:valyl-tRNA synthetase